MTQASNRKPTTSVLLHFSDHSEDPTGDWPGFCNATTRLAEESFATACEAHVHSREAVRTRCLLVFDYNQDEGSLNRIAKAIVGEFMRPPLNQRRGFYLGNGWLQRGNSLTFPAEPSRVLASALYHHHRADPVRQSTAIARFPASFVPLDRNILRIQEILEHINRI